MSVPRRKTVREKKPSGDKITTLDEQPFTTFLLTSVGIFYNNIKYHTRANNMDILHHNTILNNLLFNL